MGPARYLSTADLLIRASTRVEGLGGLDGSLTPLQQSFVDHFAIQCGFCTPGLLLTLSALLDANPNPDRKEIENAISGNLCRCTGYTQIVEAVEAVSQEERS